MNHVYLLRLSKFSIFSTDLVINGYFYGDGVAWKGLEFLYW